VIQDDKEDEQDVGATIISATGADVCLRGAVSETRGKNQRNHWLMGYEEEAEEDG